MLRYLILLFFVIAAPAQADTFALVGATLVDLHNFGRSGRDISNSVVIVSDGRIVAAGAAGQVRIPAAVRRIQARGKWLIPGLIDGFSAQLDEGFANANLAMGVTTISQTVDRDPRRGPYRAFPIQPVMKRLGRALGYHMTAADMRGDMQAAPQAGQRLGEAAVRADVDAQAAKGIAGIMLMYPLDDAQLRWAADEARKRGLFTIGELGHASYTAAAAAGVQTFIHAPRYLLELTPPDLHEAVANEPFEGPSAVQERYSAFLSSAHVRMPAFAAFAGTLAAHHVALMPTLTIVSTYLPDTPDPWRSPIGPLIDVARIRHLPFDPATGRAGLPAGVDAAAYRSARVKQALAMIEDTRAFHRAGVIMLTGSGAVAFGVLPGWGEHIELSLLVRSGLTPREALAAASENFAAVYGWQDVGRVAPGYRADMVLLKRDPTRDITAAQDIDAVFLAGQQLDRAALLAWRPR